MKNKLSDLNDHLFAQLKAAKLFAEHGGTVLPHLPMIGKSE